MLGRDAPQRVIVALLDSNVIHRDFFVVGFFWGIGSLGECANILMNP